MKKFIAVLFTFAALGLTAVAQDNNDQKWEQANTAFAEGDYTQAIGDYQSILLTGNHSWELYYNLGSAYFKNSEFGKAILNFERAARLNPKNEDIEHNLAVARAHIVDKIDAVPSFFLVEWLAAVRDSITSNGWTILMIVFIALASAFFILWRLKRSKGAMSLSIVMICIAALMLLFAHSAYSNVNSSDEAVILNTASVVRSSPDTKGKELFVLHEGTKVELLDKIGNYNEIRIASGNKGWVLSSDIEQI